MKNNPMMSCGHAANATSQGKPCCAICIGLHPGARVIAHNVPSLAGRIATCGGHSPVSSNTNLAFFKHCPNQETDDYYCGHAGWD